MLAEHNLVPVANAGIDKIVWLPLDTVTLDGSNSSDDQQIVSYQWTCESHRSCLLFLPLQRQLFQITAFQSVQRHTGLTHHF